MRARSYTSQSIELALGVGAEGQRLGREAVDDLVDNLAGPAKGIDNQLGAGHWRLLAHCKALPQGAAPVAPSTWR
jgi:hypothetical protein